MPDSDTHDSSQDRSDVLPAIKKLVREVARDPQLKLEDGDELLTAGILSSLDVVELVARLEEHLGVSINSDLLTTANLNTPHLYGAGNTARALADRINGASLFHRSIWMQKGSCAGTLPV